MTAFQDLQIGERFHFNVDADGHEPYMYKISDAQAYVEHGSHQGMRKDVDASEIVHVWSKPVALHTAPTEVERAALTLLMGPRGNNPASVHVGLHAYIWALATDPAEMRDLDTFIFESYINIGNEDEPTMMPLRELCADRGQICYQREWDHDNSAYCAILDKMPTGKRLETHGEKRGARTTRASAILADAIRKYRVAERPEGDQSYTISGMGSPLLTVTTSLAAAISEFHFYITNIYAGMIQDMERRNEKGR